jgi:hypothetical protein
MPLTREFAETVASRARVDRAYRKELLREALLCLTRGELRTAQAILRNYLGAC